MPTSALMANYARNPVRFVRGEGVWIEDDEGRRYLDAFSGVAVSALGHAHPALVRAVTEQVQQVLHVSNHYEVPLQEELAVRLRTAVGFDSRVLLCNSGAEAIEGAVKLARLHGNVRHGGRKPRLVALQGGFHGRTLGALALAGNADYRAPFAPLAPVDLLPFGDAEAVERVVGHDVAAVVLEIVQGEGGVRSCPKGYLQHLREVCDEAGALLVVDEVQTGVGRTGAMFAFQEEGVMPDVVTLAKGLAGGVPIGAVVATPEVADLLVPGLHGTTFGGSPLACAAALAVLDVVEGPGFLDHVGAVSAVLEDGLRELFSGREVHGRGLLRGVRVDAPVSAVIDRARQAGLVVGPSAQNTLRIAPPLVISADEVAELLERLARAVGPVSPLAPA